MQKEIGIAYSNDSSSAFWHAINGISFDSSAGGLSNGKIKREVDFNLPYDSQHDSLIDYNMKWLLDLIKVW